MRVVSSEILLLSKRRALYLCHAKELIIETFYPQSNSAPNSKQMLQKRGIAAGKWFVEKDTPKLNLAKSKSVMPQKTKSRKKPCKEGKLHIPNKNIMKVFLYRQTRILGCHLYWFVIVGIIGLTMPPSTNTRKSLRRWSKSAPLIRVQAPLTVSQAVATPHRTGAERYPGHAFWESKQF